MHFVRFLEHGLKGKTAPLEVVRDQIVELVLQSRRQKLRACATPCTSKFGRTVRCAVKICEFLPPLHLRALRLTPTFDAWLGLHFPCFARLTMCAFTLLLGASTTAIAQADSTVSTSTEPAETYQRIDGIVAVIGDESSWPATSATA